MEIAGDPRAVQGAFIAGSPVLSKPAGAGPARVTAVVARAALGGAVTYPEPEYAGGGEHSGTFRPSGSPRDLDYGHGSGAHYLAQDR